MVKNIKFERVSPLQAELRDPGLVYHVIACTASETRLVKLVLECHIMVQYLLQCRDMID